MRRIAIALALALSSLGCGLFGGQAPLVTVDTSRSSGCVLSSFVVDVGADSTYGTVDKRTGEPLPWPSGFTGRWAGFEVEVLDPDGNVVLKTPGRYSLSPIYGPGFELLAVCGPMRCRDADNAGGFDCDKFGGHPL